MSERVMLSALVALTLTISAHAQGGFTAPSPAGGLTVKMGKPDPKMAAKFKAEQVKLLKDLKLSAAQKSAWDGIEKKSKAERMAIVKLLQAGEGDSIALVQKLQNLGVSETKAKRALLSEPQKKVFDKSPAAKDGMIRTRKTAI